MIYDLSEHHPLTPADPEVPARMRRLRELGLGDDADAALDEFENDPSLLMSTDDPFDEVNETLTEYGLDECGS